MTHRPRPRRPPLCVVVRNVHFELNSTLRGDPWSCFVPLVQLQTCAVPTLFLKQYHLSRGGARPSDQRSIHFSKGTRGWCVTTDCTEGFNTILT